MHIKRTNIPTMVSPKQIEDDPAGALLKLNQLVQEIAVRLNTAEEKILEFDEIINGETTS